MTKQCEDTYKAGAYYGITDKQPKWDPNEMINYLKKYPRVERNLPPIKVKFPEEVQKAIDAKR